MYVFVNEDPKPNVKLSSILVVSYALYDDEGRVIAEEMVEAIENEYYINILPISKEHMKTYSNLSIII